MVPLLLGVSIIEKCLVKDVCCIVCSGKNKAEINQEIARYLGNY